jgi:pantetheine-phosphate adenylyltransferase
MRRALFPGSFDPFTLGHKDIVEKGLKIFDEVYIAIGHNANKKTMFSLEQRLDWISSVYKGNSRVKVGSYEGLTVEFCLKVDAHFILRGLRNSIDFEYEKQIAQVNSDMHDSLETVMVLSDPKWSAVSSTIIRDLIRHGGDYTSYLPAEIRIV